MQQYIEITKLYIAPAEKEQFCNSLEAVTTRKSRKCHNFSDYSLNDIEMTFKITGKMSNNYFS